MRRIIYIDIRKHRIDVFKRNNNLLTFEFNILIKRSNLLEARLPNIY